MYLFFDLAVVNKSDQREVVKIVMKSTLPNLALINPHITACQSCQYIMPILETVIQTYHLNELSIIYYIRSILNGLVSTIHIRYVNFFFRYVYLSLL